MLLRGTNDDDFALRSHSAADYLFWPRSCPVIHWWWRWWWWWVPMWWWWWRRRRWLFILTTQLSRDPLHWLTVVRFELFSFAFWKNYCWCPGGFLGGPTTYFAHAVAAWSIDSVQLIHLLSINLLQPELSKDQPHSTWQSIKVPPTLDCPSTGIFQMTLGHYFSIKCIWKFKCSNKLVYFLFIIVSRLTCEFVDQLPAQKVWRSKNAGLGLKNLTHIISVWATFCVGMLCDKNLTQICAASVTFCAESCTQSTRFGCMLLTRGATLFCGYRNFRNKYPTCSADQNISRYVRELQKSCGQDCSK